MDDMQLIDVSDTDNVKSKDKFMIVIIILLVILIILGSLTYFFGYEIFKPYIKV